MVKLNGRGMHIGACDVLIAATAMTQGLVLVTLNEKELASLVPRIGE